MSEVAASEILFTPATALAGLVREGEISSRELVGVCLDRIEALNPRLNAIVHLDADGALDAADRISAGDRRPFAGVPIAIKDLFPTAGMPLTFGSNAFGDYRPAEDAVFVHRLRNAGFVIVGMSATPEFGILPTTETQRYGPTRNPWDPERTPGGSSGGAGAAVASGMLPIANGSDGGGSIRIPAACCGLVGLKASRNRVSMAPFQGEHLTTIVFGLTRTIADTAALLDVMAGPDLGDAAWAPDPPEPFAAAAAREPGRLRIAMTAAPPVEDAQVDPINIEAMRDAGALLESLGHDVVDWDPPWSDPQLLAHFTVHFATGSAGYELKLAAELAGRDPEPADCEPLSWELYKLATETFTAVDYFTARTRLQLAGREIIRAIDDAGFDVLLTPALGQRPVRIGEINGDGPEPLANFARAAHFTPFTAVANVSGQPAISLPVEPGPDGLPTAIQLIGPPLGEGLLLSLAAQIEAAQPWAQRRPPLLV
jgi:amidase